MGFFSNLFGGNNEASCPLETDKAGLAGLSEFFDGDTDKMGFVLGLEETSHFSPEICQQWGRSCEQCINRSCE
jgi:hypothetical protein